MTISIRTIENIRKFLVDYSNKSHTDGYVLGISGGVDSSVLFKILEGTDLRVIGVMMPIHSSKKDEIDARELTKNTNKEILKVDLTDVYDKFLDTLPNREMFLANTNISPRLRSTTLYHIAQVNNLLVASASNKSEFMTGYFTKFGDSACDVMPLREFLKREIYEMAKLLKVPYEIVGKPPSAGLYEGQTDEAELQVSYDDLDNYLSGTTVSMEAEERIKSLISKSEHKRNLPIYQYIIKERMNNMSGHSKWNNIKNKKGKEDAKRAKEFTKIAKYIMVAVKEGGSNPDFNPSLKAAIDKGKAVNMPADNIERAIKKGAGELEGVNYEEITYEGYGGEGVAVMVHCLTDNRNRTAADIRHTFDKYGGNLGTNGSVSYMFNMKGYIAIEQNEEGNIDFDELMMEALEAGADDAEADEDVIEIYTDPKDFESVRDALSNKGYEFAVAEVTYLPDNTIELEEGKKNKVMKLIDALEDNDDVQEVYHNLSDE